MAQLARPSGEPSIDEHAVPLRRHVALARSLLDEVEYAMPVTVSTPRPDISFAARGQLAEELARVGRRLLECAAWLTAFSAGAQRPMESERCGSGLHEPSEHVANPACSCARPVGMRADGSR